MGKNLTAKASLIASMFIFGSIGIFVNFIGLPSGFIAFSRGIIGAACLMIFALITKTKISFKNIKENIIYLTLSGAAIGFNWILLFEAYRYTSVSTATLCYYMAPVFVMLVSPLFLGERLTALKLFCIVLSLIGMFFVSGVMGGQMPQGRELIGIISGLSAAVLYATVIILNKKLKDISSHNTTLVQLGVAGLVIMPYTLLAEDLTPDLFSPLAVCLLVCVGVIHTGVAYLLYFGAVKGVPAQTVAIFSYIDPAVAIALAALILCQKMNVFSSIGAILILSSAILSEIKNKQSQF
ncbi:MAG: EamA family transporter [Clostridia bacterium]|nr:EamA family transporter [Clostridia bacterium]